MKRTLKDLAHSIQIAAVWHDGDITFPAYLWEQVQNEINPESPVHDFTDPVNVYSRHPHRSA